MSLNEYREPNLNSRNSARRSNKYPRLLFVDDDSALLEITTRFFEHLGYIVKTADGGSKALALIKESHDVFDIVITDYSMPGMDGIELAMSVNKLLPDTPVILYTGKSEFIDKKQLSAAQIAEIVKKPCRLKELDTITKILLNEKA